MKWWFGTTGRLAIFFVHHLLCVIHRQYCIPIPWLIFFPFSWKSMEIPWDPWDPGLSHSHAHLYWEDTKPAPQTTPSALIRIPVMDIPCEAKKTAPFYFCNNIVRISSSTIIFGKHTSRNFVTCVYFIFFILSDTGNQLKI